MNMNKLYFSLTTSIIFTAHHSLWTEKPVLPVEEALIELIKDNLWIDTVTQNTYTFITAHLHNGRAASKIFDYCVCHSAPLQSENYLSSLIQYHKISFFHFLSPTPGIKEAVKEHELELLKNIINVQNAFNLMDIDIKAELENTCRFIQQLNEHYYYNYLNIPQRLIVWRDISQWVGFLETRNSIDEEVSTQHNNHDSAS